MIIKPAGAACNLNCDYCYYKEKSYLYPAGTVKGENMSDEVLERLISTYISSSPGPYVHFVWHGGEPMLRPLSFYRKAVELQRKYSHGMVIDNCIQTNGTLLTDDWCRFLSDSGWLVGLSIDGPENIHDTYRRTASGAPTFRKVMDGIGLLEKYHVEWNAMAVVNDYSGRHPLEFYHFFKSIGCRFLQFTPVTERILKSQDGRHLASPDAGCAPRADFSVTADLWGDFLCAIFDEWVHNDVGSTFVQIFDATLANWAGVNPGLCSMAKECNPLGAVEYNGDVYSCDHYVFPEYRLGNLLDEDLEMLLGSGRHAGFLSRKQSSLTRQCRECPYLFACNGDCPRNRFAFSEYGEPGHSCLCAGFRKFFGHAAPYMDFMKSELLARRAPANVMTAMSEKKARV